MAKNSGPKVFISRTSELQPFAELAKSAASEAGFQYVEQTGMQPSGLSPLEYCLDLVGRCDIYLGIIGFYFGTKVAGTKPARSITQAEYDAARQLGKTIMIFLIPTKFTGASGEIFVDPNRVHNRLQARFREEVSANNVIAPKFNDFDSFKSRVDSALLRWRPESESESEAENQPDAPRRVAKVIRPVVIGPRIQNSSVLFDSSTELNIVECGPSEIRIRRFPSGIASSAIRLQGPIEQLVASQDGVVLVARTSSQLNVFINTGGLEFVPWENAFPMEDDDIVISSVRRHLRTVEVFVRKSNRIDGLRIDQSGRSLRVEGVLDQVSDCAVDGASLASISDTGQLSVPGLPSSVLNMSAEWSSIDCSNKDGVRLVAAAGQENGLGKLLVVRTENDASEVRTSEWDSPLASVMVPRPDYPLNGLSHVAANSVNQSLVWRWQDLEPSLIGESK